VKGLLGLLSRNFFQAATNGSIRATPLSINCAASHNSTVRWAFNQNCGELPNRRASYNALVINGNGELV
jgi:hypothetical protein